MSDTYPTSQSRQALETIQQRGLDAVRDLLERARDQVLRKLADAPSEYDVWFYRQLEAEAERALRELQDPLTARLYADVQAAAEAMDAGVDPLKDIGIEVGGVGWTREHVRPLSQAAIADRVTTLIEGGQAKVKSVLQQGMLGVLTPQEVQKAIAGQLDVAKGFGPLWYRADMIWTTEVNRVCNQAAIARAKEIERRSPGKMKKRWLHSGSTRWPRQHHVTLGELPAQAIDEPYNVNGYLADGPHADNLPAGEVIKCGCTLLVEFAEAM